jgi:hypothetical protein
MSYYPHLSNFYSSIGTKSGGTVKPEDGTVNAFMAINTGTADKYLMFFDAIVAPVTNALPLAVFPIYQRNGYLEITPAIIGAGGIPFTSGIAWGFSTNALSYQPATATECIINMFWG